jgi:hypothetical protein
MAQAFPPWTNVVARWAPSVAVVLGLALATVSALGVRSDFNTGVGARVMQPVQFSHRHHVRGLGLDCRFCHTKVERAAAAGIPDTHTCMGCHSQIWPSAPLLAPVRESYASGRRLKWNRVYRLPDHVYFNHSIHVRKGVGCVTCHGKVSEMPLTAKARPFFMFECLDCHRNPDPHLRPLAEITNEQWRAPDQATLGARLRHEYDIHPKRLVQCNVCHR